MHISFFNERWLHGDLEKIGPSDLLPALTIWRDSYEVPHLRCSVCYWWTGCCNQLQLSAPGSDVDLTKNKLTVPLLQRLAHLSSPDRVWVLSCSLCLLGFFFLHYTSFVVFWSAWLSQPGNVKERFVVDATDLTKVGVDKGLTTKSYWMWFLGYLGFLYASRNCSFKKKSCIWMNWMPWEKSLPWVFLIVWYLIWSLIFIKGFWFLRVIEHVELYYESTKSS